MAANDTLKDVTQRQLQGTPGEVLAAFLKLGLTSFGGPIAHLGYFREEFVARRGWIDDRFYADLVALGQFLPEPASSQVGFALGLQRAGPAGALAAWLGFTLPSALLLMLFALGAAAFSGPLGIGVLHGLKLVAIAIVAQAVWGMARTLCPDRSRQTIALAAVLMVVLIGGATGQLGAILLGGLAGLWLCRDTPGAPGEALHFPVSRQAGIVALVLFLILIFGLFRRRNHKSRQPGRRTLKYLRRSETTACSQFRLRLQIGTSGWTASWEHPGRSRSDRDEVRHVPAA